MAYTVRHGEKQLAKSAVTLAADQAAGAPHGTSVVVGSAGLPEVDIDATDTSFSYGVTIQDLAAGQSGAVCELGDTLVRAGATYALGVGLTTNADGEFITAVTGDRVKALALEAATAADLLFLARIIPAGPIL